MVRPRVSRFSNGNAGWHSRFAIDRGSSAAESGAGGVRANDVDLAAGENPRAIASLASGDRSGLAAAGIRARVRSARRDRAGAEAFRGSERDRTGTTAHFARPHDARFSRGYESTVSERIRLSAVDASGKHFSRASA